MQSLRDQLHAMQCGQVCTNSGMKCTEGGGGSVCAQYVNPQGAGMEMVACAHVADVRSETLIGNSALRNE